MLLNLVRSFCLKKGLTNQSILWHKYLGPKRRLHDGERGHPARLYDTFQRANRSQDQAALSRGSGSETHGQIGCDLWDNSILDGQLPMG
jgi:hypothetical protein